MSTDLSLKAKNRSSLWALFTFNLAVFSFVLIGGNVKIITNDFQSMLSIRASGILLAPIILFITNGILTSSQKAFLVFWRFSNILPGSRAFSVHAKKDPRVDMAKLASLYNPLPNSPREQNALWYKIYRANMTDVGIQKSHKDFLLARDMASMLFLFFLLMGMPMLFLGFYPLNFYYLAFLAFEYLLVVRVARNYGVSFVNNVLALESSKLG